ncbi:family 1 glycosylhydrolase [uncultured Bifidobacterium sp.]|uniref:glycoside hydrolase family 1 protein n=1 Tax=uncultured Bifidobacterium sp. TaxID=165187 RepID=UPI0026177F1D|nr:family 1 glycosylhydrolase [uncultured Bifidobacterium sp.]
MSDTHRFELPADFTWGTATASFQVEGAAREDGREDSIWDTFCREPGRILDGSNGDQACDEYHRYPEDISLMKEMGVGAYRLSVAWPRIFPSAQGRLNQAGLDHYRRVLDMLRDQGIKPVVTLYHWDLPQYLQDAGGWPNRDTAKRYAEYAGVLARAFGDSVDTWTTLNEPWCTAYLGYGNGAHAPGIRDYDQALATVHHLNLAHGLGAQAIRAELGDKARVSVTLNLQVNRAESGSEEDLAAKTRADLFANEVWLGPMLAGTYDQRIREAAQGITDWRFVREGDLETIHQPLDVLGINYYSTNHVQARRIGEGSTQAGVGPQGSLPDQEANAMPAQESVETLPPRGELTAMGWNQEPRGLTDLLLEVSHRFPDLDLMVTENGSAWEDEVSPDPSQPGGKIVHDPKRVTYLEQHVRAVAKAIQDGARVTGYFAWSLLDNFEWALGYTKRFGLIRVDYPTQERIWKDSGRRYARIVKDNAI